MSDRDVDRLLNQLSSLGKDINYIDKHGNNLLINGIIKGRIKYVLTLIKAGVDVNFHNKMWQTALMYIESKGGEDSIAMLRALIKKGADTNKQNYFGETAMIIAAMNLGEYSEEILRLLIDAGANPNIQDVSGKTALMYATHNIEEDNGSEYSEGILRLLIDVGADPNMLDVSEMTALMFAVQHGNEHVAGMIRLLLDVGVDTNKQNWIGWTALMYAAENGGDYAEDIIHKLVNSGADINIKNKNNEIAYDIALKANNLIAANLLKQYEHNLIFNPKINIPLKLWSEQNIQYINDITEYWEDHEQSGFGKLPWEIIIDIILPMTVDRKDTV